MTGNLSSLSFNYTIKAKQLNNQLLNLQIYNSDNLPWIVPDVI